ncbi:MAG: hypothetical protein AB7N76_27350 [Planctomycetota bacterium]
MDCADVRARILGEEELAPCAAHLQACPPCQELASGLGRRLGAEPSDPAAAPPDLDPALLDFGALEAALAQEQGALARLRALPTGARRGLVVGAALALGGATWLLAEEARDPRTLVTLGSLSLLCALALWHGLRPLHQPPLPRWAWAGLLVGGLALPVLVACQPPIAQGDGHAPAAACLAFGALFALPVLALAFLVDRAPVAAALGSGGLLVAVAAGSVGNVCLEGHCATGGLAHRLFGHASLGVCFLGVVYALARVRR